MYNKEFQIVDTEEKAYFLGQAFGDGCNQYIKKKKFALASIDTDTDLYVKLHQIFPFLKLKKYKSSPNLIRLECYEKDFSLDLKELGLTQNKTKQGLEHNFNFPRLKNDLISHFIRGLFDADGSVWTPSRYRSRNNLRVEFSFSTKDFCVQLCDILRDNNINFKFREIFKKLKDKKYVQYRIEITSRIESLKFYTFIYKDAHLYLDRKKKIFETYKLSEKQRIKQKCPSCPICGNIPKFNGRRGNKQRFLCTKCNHNFSVPLPLIQEIV